MTRRNLLCGVLTALLLFTVTVLPLAAGGKQEKADEEKKSEQSSQQQEDQQKEQASGGTSESEGTPISTGSGNGNGSQAAAVVDGEEIPMSRFNQFVQMQQMQYMQQGRQVQGAQLEEVKKQVLDYLIDQEVLFQTAREEGYTADEQNVEQQIQQYKSQSGGEEQFRKALAQQGMTEDTLKKDVQKQLILQKFIKNEFESNVSVSDSEAQEFYDENPDYFTQKEQVQAQHIIIRVEQDAAEEKVEEARKKIEQVQQKLENGGNFANLAKEYSEGPSSKDGGSLGFIQRGQMVPEFEKTAFDLQPGEVSDIIRTQFGFHIVKVNDRKEEELSPYQEVKADIVNHLKTVKMDKEVQSFLEEKKKDMNIERYALSG